MIIIDFSLHQKLFNIAISHSPYECCGYLLGDFEKSKVKEIFLIENIHPNPKDFFTFDPQDQIKALKLREKNHLDFIGIFHSHPHSKAYPSKEDLKYLDEGNYSYCIISLNPQEIRSFKIHNSKVYQEKIKILSAPNQALFF